MLIQLSSHGGKLWSTLNSSVPWEVGRMQEWTHLKLLVYGHNLYRSVLCVCTELN